MKKLFVIPALALLLACSDDSANESIESSDSDPTEEIDSTEEEPEPEHETEPYSSVIRGKWKVVSIDGNTEVMDQVFDFQDNGDCVQTIQGQVMPAGGWKMNDDEGMLYILHAEGDGQDQLKVLEMSEDVMKWNWEGKELGVLELKRVTE